MNGLNKKIVIPLITLLALMTTNTSIYAQEGNKQSNFNQNQSVPSLVNISGTFSSYIPYVQFNNYEYRGYGLVFDNQFTLLEFQPDAQGLYQIVAYINGEAVAFVYQLRNDGLYELARFDGYGDVVDLRNNEAVNDGSESLILSSDLSLGQQFSSGYHNEYTRTIRAILPTFHKNGNVYQEVVAIEETGYADGSAVWYYLAPTYGIICIEKVDANGNQIGESALVTVYNEINQ